MVGRRRCGRRSARVAGRLSAVLTGPRGTYSIGSMRAKQTNYCQLGDEAGTQLRAEWKRFEQSLSNPRIEKREVRKCDGTQLRSGGGSALRALPSGQGFTKGNSRFVHARTNHVQRKNDTGRATWALISLAFTVHRACLSPPTRERGSWHRWDRSRRCVNVERACVGKE
jgi:hypothetical protein